MKTRWNAVAPPIVWKFALVILFSVFLRSGGCQGPHAWQGCSRPSSGIFWWPFEGELDIPAVTPLPMLHWWSVDLDGYVLVRALPGEERALERILRAALADATSLLNRNPVDAQALRADLAELLISQGRLGEAAHMLGMGDLHEASSGLSLARSVIARSRALRVAQIPPWQKVLFRPVSLHVQSCAQLEAFMRSPRYPTVLQGWGGAFANVEVDVGESFFGK